MGIVWFLKNLWAIRSFFLIIIAFLAPVPLLIDGSLEARCAYVMLAMAVLWLTEALPIYVTALMPIFLLPMLRVQPGKTVCKNYVNDTSMLFLGGLIVAVGMEEVKLHKRIAIGITKLLGSRSNTLMLGLMVPTWFLSMWISNTAATSMMVPIITAVTEQMKQMEQETNETGEKSATSMEMKDQQNGISDVDVKIEISDKKRSQKELELKRMGKGFALCVAYAANIGGISTLTGTPPNLVLQGQADKFFQNHGADDAGITYAAWMGFGVPLSLIVLLISWVWLQIYFFRCGICAKTNEKRKQAIRIAVGKEYEKLGRIKFGEITVLILFIILAVLWIVRDLPDIGGWSDGFLDENGKTTVRDSTVSILIASILFVMPVELPNIFCWYKNTGTDKQTAPHYKPILTWQVAEKKVAWGVIFLLGGGFALADACTTSGLSKAVGCELRVFSSMEPWVMNLILCLIVAAATEITSNTATASLLMPIMFELALTVGLHPLYLMMSACVACSFAFMLPVATPPNAIVFSTGYVRIPDMATAGLVMNIIAVMSLTLAINTWGSAIFKLDTLPDVFRNISSDSTCDEAPIATTINTTMSILNMTTTT